MVQHLFSYSGTFGAWSRIHFSCLTIGNGILMGCWLISPCKKWPPFRKRYFQRHFREWNTWHRKATSHYLIWTNADLIHWRIYAALWVEVGLRVDGVGGSGVGVWGRGLWVTWKFYWHAPQRLLHKTTEFDRALEEPRIPRDLLCPFGDVIWPTDIIRNRWYQQNLDRSHVWLNSQHCAADALPLLINSSPVVKKTNDATKCMNDE